MLINGQNLNPDDLDGLMNALSALPSGVSRRKTDTMETSYSAGSLAWRYRQKARTALETGRQTGNRAAYESALENFLLASQASEKEGNPSAQADNLSGYGRVCLGLGLYEQAIPALEKAAAIDEAQGNLEGLFDTNGLLHAAFLEIAGLKEKSGEPHAAEILRARLRPLRQRAFELFNKRRGEPENPEAYGVEQGEIGFSAEEPIGTQNLNQCICVIIRDPVTHKTALAHIDQETAMSSLQVAFDRLPHDGAHPLQVRLFGASLKNIPDQFGRDAKNNIKKVLSFLKDKPVDILSASIMDLRQPVSVVVYPESFDVREERPGRANPDEVLANARPFVSLPGKPLHVAFDLTCSKARAPVLLRETDVSRLREWFLGKTEAELYAWYRKYTQYDYSQFPVAVEQTIRLSRGYTAAVDNVIDCLDRKLDRLREQGVAGIASLERDMIADMIRRHAIHIGENAAAANQPLVDFIENDLFTIRPDGVCMVNIHSFETETVFPGQPYTVIESAGNADERHEDSGPGRDGYEPEPG